MKLALLSDIHANLQAFDACLAHARAQGADQVALLGDLVGYGADPAAVMARVMALAGQGALVLKGNHDELALEPPATVQNVGDSTAGWTHAQLDAAQKEFLAALPLTIEQGDMLLVHASADAPERWRYVQDTQIAALSLDAASAHPQVRYVFGGHVHHQSLYYRSATGKLMPFVPTPGVAVPVPHHRHWLATVGSVGQPRDGDPRAMYALFDTERMLLSFQRVPYDWQSAAAAIRQAGLPALFADRLEQGR
jgi:diadenosine tetraphosphatase ApaH/serine/threonine PP2A family protein phosphatase